MLSLHTVQIAQANEDAAKALRAQGGMLRTKIKDNAELEKKLKAAEEELDSLKLQLDELQKRSEALEADMQRHAHAQLLSLLPDSAVTAPGVRLIIRLERQELDLMPLHELRQLVLRFATQHEQSRVVAL